MVPFWTLKNASEKKRMRTIISRQLKQQAKNLKLFGMPVKSVFFVLIKMKGLLVLVKEVWF